TWQGAIASLAGASATSFAVMLTPTAMSALGNPILPSVGVALLAGILVSFITPRNKVSPDEALALLTAQRDNTDKHPITNPATHSWCGVVRISNASSDVFRRVVGKG